MILLVKEYVFTNSYCVNELTKWKKFIYWLKGKKWIPEYHYVLRIAFETQEMQDYVSRNDVYQTIKGLKLICVEKNDIDNNVTMSTVYPNSDIDSFMPLNKMVVVARVYSEVKL